MTPFGGLEHVAQDPQLREGLHFSLVLFLDGVLQLRRRRGGAPNHLLQLLVCSNIKGLTGTHQVKMLIPLTAT